MLLLPLSLSKTQDDKGRVRWSLFGGSEQGPARPFWKSFYTAPRREVPREWSEGFIRRLLGAAYDEKPEALTDLRKAGFRVYTNPDAALLPSWKDEPLPKWTEPYRWEKGLLRGVRYLLTFCPWKFLPAAVRKSYLAGQLNLLPFPGSLVFFVRRPTWNSSGSCRWPGRYRCCRRCSATRPPARSAFPSRAGCTRPGRRVPTCGCGSWQRSRTARLWAGPGHVPPLAPLAADPGNEDPLTVAGTEDKLTHVLLSTAPDDISLYNKPMARNAQIWSHDYEAPARRS